MRTHRGDYAGASEFALFDKAVRAMDLEECRCLLECILHRAMPGSNGMTSDLVYRELSIAEQFWREGGSEKPVRRLPARRRC